MVTLVSIALTICAALVAVPVIIFSIEVVAATIFLHRQTTPLGNPNPDPGPRVVVLVPAHDESVALKPTLADIKRQLRAKDRVLVVADNCTDDTPTVAAACGAEVVERRDFARRGKGYALDFGLQHLNSDSPDIVIMVDADCRLAENALDQLAAACSASHRPVQALYLMTAPADAQINHQVAEFAWRVKNWLRPSGLRALRLPCQLTGSGMAFPWDVIRSVNLASGWIVEDLKLGLDLASKGHPPVFCPSARMTSQFASSIKGAATQRERWERGHIRMILSSVPRLLGDALAHRNWSLLALTLDLAVPPLSLLAILVIGMFAIAFFSSLFGSSSLALAVSVATMLVFLLATCLAWLKCGRDILPMHAFLLIVPYILRKIGLYTSVLSNETDAPWIKTDRTKSE